MWASIGRSKYWRRLRRSCEADITRFSQSRGVLMLTFVGVHLALVGLAVTCSFMQQEVLQAHRHQAHEAQPVQAPDSPRCAWACQSSDSSLVEGAPSETPILLAQCAVAGLRDKLRPADSPSRLPLPRGRLGEVSFHRPSAITNERGSDFRSDRLGVTSELLHVESTHEWCALRRPYEEH